MEFQTFWWLLYEYTVHATVIISITVLVGYYYGTSTYDYWKKKGVAYIKPKYPFLGSTYDVAFRIKCNSDRQCEIYKHLQSDRIGGYFSFKTPVLFVKDPSLIDSILNKDFQSFYNRDTEVDPKNEPLSANLVNLKDNDWKCLRKKLTPFFSTGKLKFIYENVLNQSQILIDHIDKFADRCSPIQVREVILRLNTDVFTNCIFGIIPNSLSGTDYQITTLIKKLFQRTFMSKLRIIIKNQCPWLVKSLGWKGSREYIQPLFISTLNSIMQDREENNEVKNDFVQLLMELKKQKVQKQMNGVKSDNSFVIDDNVIASSAFIFFVAGLETTTSTLSFCLYELSLHPDIQEQAYDHIVSVLKKHGGEITYDAIKEMTLIKQIFAETLRIHPAAVELRRTVTKDYTIPGTNVTLPKGLSVLIPVYSLHHDPEHFPDPEKFKPERFDKDKENIKKGTYLPFGDGHRVCIGARFAKMEIQVILIKLLLNFKFTLNPKTISPLVYSPTAILLLPLGGIWIDVQKRT